VEATEFDLPTDKNSTDFVLSIESNRLVTIENLFQQSTWKSHHWFDRFWQHSRAPVTCSGHDQYQIEPFNEMNSSIQRVPQATQQNATNISFKESGGGAIFSQGGVSTGYVKTQNWLGDSVSNPQVQKALYNSSPNDLNLQIRGDNANNAQCLAGNIAPVIGKIISHPQITQHQSTNTSNNQTIFLNPSIKNSKITVVHSDSIGQNTASLNSQALVAGYDMISDLNISSNILTNNVAQKKAINTTGTRNTTKSIVSNKEMPH
ncbi:hypothetical protein HAX54_014016, partial [Datura stramonium]|nr:hypothetical protein [Datura stramonium]